MKKRTKITLRTKIYLTTVALLALTGIFYAANPTPFGNILGPVGVAAAPGDVLATDFCTQNVTRFDCNGNGLVVATIPGPVGPCIEKYMAIAPIQSAAAGFTPRDVFITQGQDIFKFSGGTATLFATLGCPFSDHSSLTFDHEGTFENKMIATCENGPVWKIAEDPVTHMGIVQFIANTTDLQHPTNIEGPAVAPAGFGPLEGQILAADDIRGQVHAIAPDGTVTHNAFNWTPPDWDGAESVQVIPSEPCANCSGGAYFQAIFDHNVIIKFPLSDFAGLGGSVLVNSETGHGTALVQFIGGNYVTTLFDAVPGNQEGASFTDCNIPSPTPTATATPTATFTPTPTPTPTSTPERCNLMVTHRRSFGETVQITILNSGSTDQFITNLALSWPQGINGKLTQIKLDGVVLWNGPAANSPINFGVPPLVMNPHKRKIAHNSIEVLKFIFQNNVAPLNNPVYNGSATFESGCSLDFGLPTRRPR